MPLIEGTTLTPSSTPCLVRTNGLQNHMFLVEVQHSPNPRHLPREEQDIHNVVFLQAGSGDAGLGLSIADLGFVCL